MKKTIKCVCIIVLVLLHIAVVFYASILYNNWHNTNLLLKAIEKEDVKAVESLLEKGVDPNKPSASPSWVWTLLETSPRRPLSVACDVGNLQIVKLLIEYGATAEYVEGTEFSPLREVMFYYHPDDVEITYILLHNGADPNHIEEETCIFAAAEMFPFVYDKTKQNGTVFATGYDEETAKGITEIIDMLLEYGDYDLNANSSYRGCTMLVSAAKRGNLYLVEYLLSIGCDPSVKDIYNKTALDYATENGNEEIIKLLKEHEQKTEKTGQKTGDGSLS